MSDSNIAVNFFIPFLTLEGKENIHTFPLKDGVEPEKHAIVEEETQNEQTFKVQKVTLTVAKVVGDALSSFIQEPRKPVSQVDYTELSVALSRVPTKPKIKREEWLPVQKAVNRLHAAQSLVNKRTAEQITGDDLLMLARLAKQIYLSEEAVELTETQVEFIVKAVSKTNNGAIIMNVCDLVDPESKIGL